MGTNTPDGLLSEQGTYWGGADPFNAGKMDQTFSRVMQGKRPDMRVSPQSMMEVYPTVDPQKLGQAGRLAMAYGVGVGSLKGGSAGVGSQGQLTVGMPTATDN